jgi:pimeloyl-ACP methyl ester carboxylesterase
MKRILMDMAGGQLHARVTGSGPPLVLLHASPLSSLFLHDQMARLAGDFTCYGIDTPGYGFSDPLPVLPMSLDDYADAILSALANQGIHHFYVYGTATGAQIALAMARRSPARIGHMVLDNCAAFAQGWRNAQEADYFPDLSPRIDGSHWHRAWEVASRQFVAFPWYSNAPADQLDRPPPPAELIHAMALGFVSARPSYDVAYRLAFHAEDIASFDGLKVRTTVIDWQGSIVRKQVADLIAAGLPDCVSVVSAGPTLADRMDAISRAFSGSADFLRPFDGA